MNKRVFLSILFLFCVSVSIAQILVVKDAETKEPVVDIALYNKNKTKSVFSDNKGEVDLSVFTSSETIFLQHPTYKKIKFIKSSLNSNELLIDKNIIEIEEFVISAYRWEQKQNA